MSQLSTIKMLNNYKRLRPLLAEIVLCLYIALSLVYITFPQELPKEPKRTVYAQSVPQGIAEPYRPTVMIDILHMSDNARSEIIAALIKLNNQKGWYEVKVRSGETLSDLILDKYRISSTFYPKTTIVIAEAIKEFNKLTNINSLYVGQTLLVPVLGVMPTIEAAGGLLVRRSAVRAQILELENSQIYLSRSKDVPALVANTPNSESKIEAVRGGGEDVNSSKLATGGIWVGQLSVAENDSFIQMLSEDVRKEVINKTLYSGPTDAYMVTLGYPEDASEVFEELLPNRLPNTLTAEFQPIPMQSTVLTPTPHLSTLISNLKPEESGIYYIFDFFKHKKKKNLECMHGNMVIMVLPKVKTKNRSI
jgi:hypothetical protein